MAVVFLFVYFFVKNVTPVAQHNFSWAKVGNDTRFGGKNVSLGI